MFRQGRYLESPVLPSKLGYEAAGEVAAVGPDVDKSWLGKKASTVPAFLKAKAEQYVFDHVKAGHFKPRIDRIFPFAEIVEAHRYMESNQRIGKIVVTV